MKRIKIDFVFPLIALILIVSALSQQMFGVFPLGKLLDPFVGAVQSNDDASLNLSQLTIDRTGLADPVNVFFDDRKVPHIYAKNTHDLYFAQGYVTARFRLWEMDFLTYVAAGRLSEIFAEKFFDYDRNQRRIGMLASAKSALKLIEANKETADILTAYSEGVNAYIGQLHYKNMPFEYKLLDYAPEQWSNLKSVLIMKYMSGTLSGFEEDFSMSKLMLALGEANFNKLYPSFNGHFTPVMNDLLSKPDSALCYLKKPSYLDYGFLSSGTIIPDNNYNPRLGSNSWAVSGKKTRSGFPILCSDPHLNLSLPSIWMEMQLISPDVNVYGVSIPGTPAVIIGFNENIAWGETNGEDDVKDWYKLKISPDYKRYEMDGRWLDLDTTIEEIKRRDQSSFYDTIYHTIQGPIVYDKSYPVGHSDLSNYALRWDLHRPSNEFLTFIRLAKAKNYQDYREAIQYYSCPVQNFTFACKDDTIAINHQGSMPVKWPGQGKFVLDGTQSSHLYKRYIPTDSLPHVVNPSCNYVLSANQHPTNNTYPYYYNGYYVETRANRIHQLLDSAKDIDVGKMMAMQLDNTNSFSAEANSFLTGALPIKKLTVDETKYFEILRSWTGSYNLSDGAAKLFELWWRKIKDYTWDEFATFSFSFPMPDDAVLLDLIRKDPDNEYFDKQGTAAKENATDIIYEAFVGAVAKFKQMSTRSGIKWGDVNKVDIMHLTNIGAFSVMDLSSAGNPGAINAVSSNWGPSWRMIVELGNRPRAYGIYAGGQSGSIGSAYYDNFIKDWVRGVYYPLQYFESMEEAKKGAGGSWLLK
jgi:penicillin G amidase